MQDMIAEMLWKNDDIPEQAARLCQTLPGFDDARQAYDALSVQLREAAGPSLYDQYITQLLRYTNYEVRAYYALGLGLREAITKALGV